MHHATGFVARMGWDAEPEICANVIPLHRKKFPMGKEGTCRKEEQVSKPTPSPCGQGVLRTARGFKTKHTLKCCVRNLMLLTMWAAALLTKASWLAVSLLQRQIVFEVHTPGTFHMYHISAQMFGAQTITIHNNLWIEHLSLGETKLISCSLGFNTRRQQNRSRIQSPSCRCSHAQHTSFTSGRVTGFRARYYRANFFWPDKTQISKGLPRKWKADLSA